MREQSPRTIRTRAVTGVFFVAFGVAIVVQTLAKNGVGRQSLSGAALGLAMVGLGATRLQAYLAFRRASRS
jgi:hypothetical protein